MPDTREGRDEQARDAANRQRERAILEYLERWDEVEPPVEEAALEDVEPALSDVDYPATGNEVVSEIGDSEVKSVDGTVTIADLVPGSDAVTFDAAADVRVRLQRPTVAAAMKRVVEVGESHADGPPLGSRREAYEKTLRALAGIDAVDEDEGIDVVSDWIVDRVRQTGSLPGSRDVRRRAAEFCRENGYEVSVDEWLGV